MEGNVKDVTDGRSDSKKARGGRISMGLSEVKGRAEHGDW